MILAFLVCYNLNLGNHCINLFCTDTDIGASEAGIEMGVAPARPIPKANCLASHGRFLSGLVTAMVTGLTWVGLTQIIKEAELQHLLKSPAGLTYFCSGWLMLAFPPYLLMNVLVKHKNMKEVLRYVQLSCLRCYLNIYWRMLQQFAFWNIAGKEVLIHLENKVENSDVHFANETEIFPLDLKNFYLIMKFLYVKQF